MKCRSVACIWSGAPPLHRITATAVLNRPPTLYTGGSDGSIIWWNLSGDEFEPEIKPIAMLCGHAAPIADLCICFPVVDSRDKKIKIDSTNAMKNLHSSDYGALLSACSDGLLCLWSRGSGHCRRRRKMPPWLGSPSVVSPLHSNPRYVCISCCSIDSSGYISDHNSSDTQNRRPSKCSVVIIDSYTLTVLQTVFHEKLPTVPLKFMAVITSTDNMEKQLAVLADLFGKLQLIPISSGSNSRGDGGTALRKSSHEERTICEGSSERGQVVSVALCKQIVALIYKTFCIFRHVITGADIGEISFKDDIFSQSHVVGGMFLDIDDFSEENRFAVWNSRGAAVVYKILHVDKVKVKSLCEIPAVSCPLDFRLSICFVKLKCYILRIESLCYQHKEPLVWKPQVTVWSLGQLYDDPNNSSQKCKMLGKGSVCFDEIEQDCVLIHKIINNSSLDNEIYSSVQSERIVTSSMVISENLYTPYAVVYGFCGGEIEMVRFDMYFDGHKDKRVSKQHFLGHKGAILCLATHRMVGRTNSCTSCNNILLSGSMDCTVRVWDLDNSNIIIVMHQHIAPVRQLILPPPYTARPWNSCFLSVGEDSCVSLASLETLRVERMFVGHISYPSKIVWDGRRGYLACLCPNFSDVLYIWDIKTGTRERVLRGTASHSMFDNFCKGLSIFNSDNTSHSSLLLPIIEDGSLPHSQIVFEMGSTSLNLNELNASQETSGKETAGKFSAPLKCSCPFPGIATLTFDLAELMSPSQYHRDAFTGNRDSNNEKTQANQQEADVLENPAGSIKKQDWVHSVGESLLRFSLSYLHLWDVDYELDKLLTTEMNLNRPEKFILSSGLEGDRGSLTLTFPSLTSTLELWKSSSEFSAMRSLTMVSLAQRMVSLSHASSDASCALAAFYTRSFAEKFPSIKPPLLQLLVSFWQDKSEHVRMAARSIFHCAASRAIPAPLCHQETRDLPKIASPTTEEQNEQDNLNTDDEILSWLESYEMQDWISCIGGTSQDAMTSHIIVASALSIWYPSRIKPTLPTLVINPLIKLVMAMNEKYSSTAAELLAEGMESTWKACIGPEIHRLIGDIFFQIECVTSATSASQPPAVPVEIRETLVGVLLPSLAMADVLGFLTVIESQIWSTASDSPVHLVSLMILIRVVKGAPRNLAQYLDKVVNFILQTMDHGNSVMRRICLQSSMTALNEVARVFPMVALSDTSTRLAVGDAIGDINSSFIRVYDMQSVTKIKVLDASGPPGIPSLLAGGSEATLTTLISALSFSPDGEGLISFSEHGLMIRWWSLGSAWWDKLSRNIVPVHCTKLIFVPPWEGFSPNTSRTSVMASIMGHDRQSNFQDNTRSCNEADSLKLLIHNLDLSYRLEWVGERKVLLTRHGQELGTFQL